MSPYNIRYRVTGTALLGVMPVICLLAIAAALCAVSGEVMVPNIQWVHLSSKKGDLPAPLTESTQQTGTLVADFDKDGVKEFVLSYRFKAPALIWYRRAKSGWEQQIIEKDFLTVEAGGTAYDIDGDGDLDIVFGSDSQNNKLWWWENPSPKYDPQNSWKRHVIKNSGANQHHDQVFGDFKGAGKPQLAFWNQKAKTLFLADIPADPRNTESWPYDAIFSGQAGEGVDKAALYAEGAAGFDVDGDGRLDLLAGNYWFEHEGGMKFKPIKVGSIGGRIAAGRFKAGKIAQIVIAPGDGSGPLKFYECKGDPTIPESWTGRDLLGRDMTHGHTLDVGDINGDGHLDIFAAEMAKWNNNPAAAPDNPGATAWILYGDGKGDFQRTELVTGHGWHEGKLGDFDGDGDLDILNKPYTWEAPRVDIWLNNGTGLRNPSGRQAGIGPSFKGPLALQLWSLRESFKREGVPATLDKVRAFGFTNVELAGTYGLTAQQFKAELDKAGLKAMGMHVSYNDLRDKLAQIIGDAKLLDVEYVGCAWIPHKERFTAEDCAQAAQIFNAFGAKLKASGLKFMYHPHGFEFVPTTGDRTLFDELVAQTKPELVDFELDIFWAYHGGADPVKLLARYQQRFALAHLKDMKQGTERNLTGKAPDESSVALGSGVIDMKAVLRAASKTRIKWYIVEEESPTPMANIPAGLRFLEQIKY